MKNGNFESFIFSTWLISLTDASMAGNVNENPVKIVV